jgi:hypothetical protein
MRHVLWGLAGALCGAALVVVLDVAHAGPARLLAKAQTASPRPAHALDVPVRIVQSPQSGGLAITVRRSRVDPHGVRPYELDADVLIRDRFELSELGAYVTMYDAKGRLVDAKNVHTLVYGALAARPSDVVVVSASSDRGDVARADLQIVHRVAAPAAYQPDKLVPVAWAETITTRPAIEVRERSFTNDVDRSGNRDASIVLEYRNVGSTPIAWINDRIEALDASSHVLGEQESTVQMGAQLGPTLLPGQARVERHDLVTRPAAADAYRVTVIRCE